MDKDTRYRLALINMAQGAQRQADACRSFKPVVWTPEVEEDAQAYERVACFLTDEADSLRKQEPG